MKLSPANPFNLDKAPILSSGKRLKYYLMQRSAKRVGFGQPARNAKADYSRHFFVLGENFFMPEDHFISGFSQLS